MGNYYSEALVTIANLTEKETAFIREFLSCDSPEGYQVLGVNLEDSEDLGFSVSLGSGGQLVVSDNGETFDSYNASTFIQSFLKKFRPEEIITFEVGFHGQESGGSAYAVSMDMIIGKDTSEIAEDLRKTILAEKQKGKVQEKLTYPPDIQACIDYALNEGEQFEEGLFDFIKNDGVISLFPVNGVNETEWRQKLERYVYLADCLYVHKSPDDPEKDMDLNEAHLAQRAQAFLFDEIAMITGGDVYCSAQRAQAALFDKAGVRPGELEDFVDEDFFEDEEPHTENTCQSSPLYAASPNM